MNIDDILESLPSREDIASAIGMQSRRHSLIGSNSDILPMLGVFGTGMLLGAGLALMFAPKSGNQLRRDLSRKAQQWGDQAQQWGEQASESAEEYFGERGEYAGQTGTQTTPGIEPGRTTYSGTTGGRNI
jgi:gas vesicle protein